MGKTHIVVAAAEIQLGFSVDAPYDLKDMAAGNIAVLDDAGYIGARYGRFYGRHDRAGAGAQYQASPSLPRYHRQAPASAPTSAAEGNLRSLAGRR